MENELKIGNYGRTNLGKIIKFAWLDDANGKRCEGKVILIDLMMAGNIRPFYYFEEGEYISKHSSKLIDIIEKRRLCKWNVSYRCYTISR